MTTSTSDSRAKAPPSGMTWRWVGVMSGRGLATLAIIAGVVVLGVRHYRRIDREAKDGSDLSPMMMETARPVPVMGTQRLNIAGLDLVVARSWEAGSPERVSLRLIQRHQALGWEVLATAPDVLPTAVRSRPEFGFLCFLTPNRRVVGYALNPDGHGTRITATEVDLRQVVAKTRGTAAAPTVSREYATLMPQAPQVSLSGAAGTEIHLLTVAAPPRTVADDIRRRLLREGWTLEPWDGIVGEDGVVPIGGELMVAHRHHRLCHVMVAHEDGETVAAYRFSESRPARVER